MEKQKPTNVEEIMGKEEEKEIIFDQEPVEEETKKEDESIKKIKKEDRAFLYFRENGLGNLNIKFGPDKYVKNTEKFYEILMYGLFKGISFLSNLTKKHPLSKRREHYETISKSLTAIINEAFPDVFQEIKNEIEMENETIKRVEAGHQVSEEFQEKFDEAKEELKKRFSDKKEITVSDNNKKLAEDIQEQMELLKETQDAILMKFYGHTDEDAMDEDESDFRPAKIVYNLIESKLFDLSKQLQACYISEEEQN